MLDSIRNSAQSFGVKVAFGVIILVFVFWGIGNFNDRDYSNVVAMVNGEPIVAQEFERAYMGAEEYILRNNPGMTREQLIKDHLGRQVLRDLIQAALVQQEARRAGMTATPLELREAVGKMDIFHNEKGSFDPAAYQRYLDNRRISAADYEGRLGNEISSRKIMELITAPVWVDPEEVRKRYDFMTENRGVNYVFVPASDFLDKARVEDKAIEDWYEANKNDFAIPQTVDVSYVVVGPDKLVDPASFQEAEALAWYEANKSEFGRAEQIRARHILIPVPEDAPEEQQQAARERLEKALAELGQGKDFAEVADAYNVEGAAGPGGELGWILRDQMVPAFEEAAFALEPGIISDPVRTRFGWHVILVDEKKEGGTQAFSEAEAEVRKALAREKGMEKLNDVLDGLIEDNITGRPLTEAALRFGLKAERSGPLNQEELMHKLGIKPEGAQALLSAPAGAPLDTALEAGDQYVIARVEASVPASVRPFAEVREEVADILKKEKALELAMAEGAASLSRFTEQTLEQLKKEGIEPIHVPVVEREGLVANFLPDQALNEAIFETEPGAWLNKPFLATSSDGQGALLVRVEEINHPEEDRYESVAGLLGRAATQERMEAVYNLFLQSLADRAKIEITNQNLIDRTGR